MKASMKAQRAPKRDLFAELSEGMTVLAGSAPIGRLVTTPLAQPVPTKPQAQSPAGPHGAGAPPGSS